LNKDKIDLNIGNEVRIVALTLLNGLILKLDNCYFVIALSRNIVPIFMDLDLLFKVNIIPSIIMIFITDMII